MMLDRDLFEFLEHTTDAAFAVTDGGDICSWNSSAEALFGFGGAEVVGKTCFGAFGAQCRGPQAIGGGRPTNARGVEAAGGGVGPVAPAGPREPAVRAGASGAP